MAQSNSEFDRLSVLQFSVSKSLSLEWERKWLRITETLSKPFLETFLIASHHDEEIAHFQKIMLGSHFVFDWVCAQPEAFKELYQSGDLYRDYSLERYQHDLEAQIKSVETEDDLKRGLRRFRTREMVRVIWRDFNRLSQTMQTCRDLSDLADAAITVTLTWLNQYQAKLLGQPKWFPIGSKEAVEMPLLVLGLGKLGGQELNLSSDIDLMFVYPEAGIIEESSKQLSHQEYYTRLGVKLIAALDQMTADGFVFRVDMRLRPYGQSGALVMNYQALENYYHEQGRDWERYAMIKSRVIVGGGWAKRRLKNIIRDFVYRRYMDYGVIEELRRLKKMINQDVRRRGLHNHVKLGEGGIREIEFIAQSYQLALGGRDSALQHRSLIKILTVLVDRLYLSQQDADALKQAYLFLRDTEHVLQGIADHQTQRLPEKEDELDRVAFLLGCSNQKAFLDLLDQYRQTVKEAFQLVVAEPEPNTKESALLLNEEVNDNQNQPFNEQHVELQAFWMGYEQDDHRFERTIGSIDIEHQAQIKARLKAWQKSSVVKKLEGVGLDRLNRAMPVLLYFVFQRPDASVVLDRLLPFLDGIVRRSVYLAFLSEHPHAMSQLVGLFAASPWIAELLTQTPALLDELIDTRVLYHPPDRGGLNNELQQQFLRIESVDLEYVMERLRHFVKSHYLRVAACEISQTLPLMHVSDYLTHIADVTLQSVLTLAWQQLVAKHGTPTDELGPVAEPQMIVVGYGKLGGLELSYGSDLDLVLIYEASPKFLTNGSKR